MGGVGMSGDPRDAGGGEWARYGGVRGVSGGVTECGEWGFWWAGNGCKWWGCGV